MAGRGFRGRRAAAVVLATLVIIVPLGVLRHLLDDHLGGGARSLSGLHVPSESPDTADRAACPGHRHVWVIVAAAAPSAVLCAPCPVVGSVAFETTTLPSPPSLPPFSPPRA